MCAFVYVCICWCIYVYTYTNPCIRAYTYMYNFYMYICIQTCMHTYMYVFTPTHAHTRTQTGDNVANWVIYTSVHAYARICSYTYGICTNISTYTRTNIQVTLWQDSAEKRLVLAYRGIGCLCVCVCVHLVLECIYMRICMYT